MLGDFPHLLLPPYYDKWDKGSMEAHPKAFASTRMQSTVSDDRMTMFSLILNFRGVGGRGRLVKKVYAEIDRKCTSFAS